MNKEFGEKVYENIIKYDNFTMSDWAIHAQTDEVYRLRDIHNADICNTAACIAGWCALTAKENNITYRTNNWIDATAELLDISFDEALALCEARDNSKALREFRQGLDTNSFAFLLTKESAA